MNDHVYGLIVEIRDELLALGDDYRNELPDGREARDSLHALASRIDKKVLPCL